MANESVVRYSAALLDGGVAGYLLVAMEFVQKTEPKTDPNVCTKTTILQPLVEKKQVPRGAAFETSTRLVVKVYALRWQVVRCPAHP